jgi:dienelactone hydrolase
VAKQAGLTGFESYPFEVNGISHQVYTCGEGAPVIVLHELPGLAQPAVNLAKRLAGEGFSVYLPHLFGPLMQYAPIRNGLALCISREFGHLRAGRDAPIASWLRLLADDVCARQDAVRIGAIGMCLTGSFAVPLVLSKGVRAAVASQPAIPISFRHLLFGLEPGAAGSALNVSDAQLQEATRRAEVDGVKLVAFRFKRDRICVHGKLARLADAFGANIDCHELDDFGDPGTRPPHAVLTEEYDKGTVQALDAYRHVVSFLRQCL